MKKLVLSLFLIALALPVVAQDIVELDEVLIEASKYKYLKQAGSNDVAIPVAELQEKVANYDVEKTDFYQDDYDLYKVTFYIPDGKVLAAYDSSGNIIRTAEKYKNVNLPMAVKTAVLKRFPNWEITKDVYLVNYYYKKGATKLYKLKLENGDKTVRIKVNETGEIQ